MALQEKILGQNRPSSSNAMTVYTVPASTTAILSTIHICNTSSNDVTFSIFMDNTGSTYDETTALYYDVDIRSKETYKIQTHIGMDTAGGTLGVKVSQASTCTFTFNGAEFT